MPVVSDVITFTRILIADILLIWRCYHVWGGSIRSIAIPLVLFTIECVIESAAIYSIILLIEAIQSVLPSSGDLVNVMNRVNDYLQELMYFATGIAPTIVVARVAIAQMKTEETGGVSYIGTHGVSSNIPANSLLNGAGIQAEEKPKSTNLHSE
uniref:Uncharacterized protein n=1 Tax=Psilocybe cubensis TaxID=181762 RepID=A0A8H7XMC9_PSICU